RPRHRGAELWLSSGHPVAFAAGQAGALEPLLSDLVGPVRAPEAKPLGDEGRDAVPPPDLRELQVVGLLQKNWYLLCGGEPEATDLYDALLAQHRRFRDVRAPGWAYGSHEASEEPFVLRPGVRQMNLQQALTISFSLAETNATTHVERAEHARSTRRVAGTAGDASGARVEAHSQEEATEA
ncbi:unnamed protein product, partial [Durusdinium trenchii]